MKKPLIMIGAICGMIAFSSTADAKPAQCEISNGESHYAGNCDFTGYKGGSFDINLPDAGFDALGSSSFEVVIKGGNRAVVYWYYPSRQPLANVIRDPRKPACWAGEGVRVCAY